MTNMYKRGIEARPSFADQAENLREKKENTAIMIKFQP